MKYLVATKSKTNGSFMLDLQIVEPDTEKLKNRIEEIIKKMFVNGDKKQLMAFSDFELYKIGEIEEDYTNFTYDIKQLVDYSEIIKEVKLKILERLKEE